MLTVKFKTNALIPCSGNCYIKHKLLLDFIRCKAGQQKHWVCTTLTELTFLFRKKVMVVWNVVILFSDNQPLGAVEEKSMPSPFLSHAPSINYQPAPLTSLPQLALLQPQKLTGKSQFCVVNEGKGSWYWLWPDQLCQRCERVVAGACCSERVLLLSWQPISCRF